MLPKKSYCFLKFKEKSHAQCVLEAMSGIARLGQKDAVLMMSYSEKLPILNQSPISTLPDGLTLVEECITEKLETMLMESLSWGSSTANSSTESIGTEGKLKNRKVQHFGYEFLYGSNNVDPNSPLTERMIPEACDEIWKILAHKAPKFACFRPDQLTVNRYEPGHGIPPHCDTHSCFEDPIVSLSLGSSVVMEFRQPDTAQHVSVLLPRRSLLIMSGASRLGWTHGITPRMSDIIRKPNEHLSVESRKLRISYTFRKLKIPTGCLCSFSSLCDVPRKPVERVPEKEVADHLAAKLEIENVHRVYNEIGSHFSETRHSPWPNVENYIRSLNDGAVLLDVGCGNGKYLGIKSNILKLGCDRSDALLKVCVERNFNVFQCDCLAVPFRDESVDSCISIAVIHHLATRERRLKAIEHMARVLIRNGTALIYVWAKDQQKENKKSSYLLQHQKKEPENPQNETSTFTIDDNEIQLPVHRNRTQFNHTNVLVPWKLKQKEVPNDQQKIFLRYYHVFEDGELEKLCSELPNIEIVKSFYDQGNHCVIIKKV